MPAMIRYLDHWTTAALKWAEESGARQHLSALTVAVVAVWTRHRIMAGLVTSSSPLPLKTRHVGQRCTLNLSRAEHPPFGGV
ncbi:hypothetical protein TNCV_309291 [Trichonephila clavipes]|nr:hypothetical protein TNCV_309291 [Trichonephila clavipes]